MNDPFTSQKTPTLVDRMESKFAEKLSKNLIVYFHQIIKKIGNSNGYLGPISPTKKSSG